MSEQMSEELSVELVTLVADQADEIHELRKSLREYMKLNPRTTEELIQTQLKTSASESNVAESYVMGLMGASTVDWAKVNKMITKRWSEHTMGEIRKLAWERIAERYESKPK